MKSRHAGLPEHQAHPSAPLDSKDGVYAFSCARTRAALFVTLTFSASARATISLRLRTLTLREIWGHGGEGDKKKRREEKKEEKHKGRKKKGRKKER